MDKISFLQDIFPWLLGTTTAICGFGIKSILDYLWLKAPRIVVRAVLSGGAAHPPQNGYRRYEYNLEIEFQNHSKNEAYGLEILKVIMPAGLHMQGGFEEKYDHVVSETISAKITGKCSITLPVDATNATAMASQRIKDIGDNIRVGYSYKNQLGKIYAKTEIIAFQKRLSIVHSTIVKSFTPTIK